MAWQRRSKLILAASLAALLLALPAAAVLLRDPLGTLLAKRMLGQLGYQCDHVEAHLPLRLPPAQIELAPMKCGAVQGPLATLDFETPAHVHLAGLTPQQIRTESLAIEMRPRAHRDVEENLLGELTKIAGLEGPTLDLLFDMADLSREKSPTLIAAHATVARSGDPQIDFHQLRIAWTASGLLLTSPRMRDEKAKLLGQGGLRLTAESGAAGLEVKFESGLPLKVELREIRSAKPKASFSLGEVKVAPPPEVKPR